MLLCERVVVGFLLPVCSLQIDKGFQCLAKNTIIFLVYTVLQEKSMEGVMLMAVDRYSFRFFLSPVCTSLSFFR